MPDYSSDLFFLQPHTERSTFLTILTILKSYNSYLANLKYWRKSLRSSIFTSSKKLNGTKGYAEIPPYSIFGSVRLFFEKIFSVSKGSPLRVFSNFATECMLINPKGSYSTFFGTMRLFLKEFFFQKLQVFFQKKMFCAF